MELVIEIPSNKISEIKNNIVKTEHTENFETQSLSDDFLANLRASVADAENPEEVFKDVLEALRELHISDKKKRKLQSAREFMLEFDQ
jgi:hypothetical protein